jgi:integrase
MALFKVNTGLREQEVVYLSWQWKVQVPELESSIFVVPRRFVKNGLDRYVVLNRIARSVIESCRGKHPEREFTRNGRPVTKIYNSGWKGARRRASERYAKEFGRPCPKGFQSLRVHDLKHTFVHRLRAAGIGFEDRKVLLGNKSDHVTTHCSAPEIGALVAAEERACELGSRKSHALSLVRSQQVAASN